MVDLVGEHDAVLTAIEDGFPRLDLLTRGNEISLTGPRGDVETVARLLDELIEVAAAGTQLSPDVVRRSVAMLAGPQMTEQGDLFAELRPSEVLTHNILVNRGRAIRPKTAGQKRYVDAIDANTVTFGIGPAGTGKTYLAMAKAVAALQARHVRRIILSRPAVEAGEKLGFLPGSLSDKIDPYLRPLYDALHDMVDPVIIPGLIEEGTIEVAPLAFLRGRSLNDAFVILDEAQNTTSEQMKMFLTRLGFGSKMVITGDSTQTDLPGGVRSGLRIVDDILTGVDDVEFCPLSSADVVRHRLVGDIIDAYARWEARSDR
ncbi:MAG: PhoH family protein [Promicromonosporaceae bacterium]|nr:PhoH family protein [Promicromonosporaceae bacterium]